MSYQTVADAIIALNANAEWSRRLPDYVRYAWFNAAAQFIIDATERGVELSRAMDVAWAGLRAVGAAWRAAIEISGGDDTGAPASQGAGAGGKMGE